MNHFRWTLHAGNAHSQPHRNGYGIYSLMQYSITGRDQSPSEREASPYDEIRRQSQASVPPSLGISGEEQDASTATTSPTSVPSEDHAARIDHVRQQSPSVTDTGNGFVGLDEDDRSPDAEDKLHVDDAIAEPVKRKATRTLSELAIDFVLLTLSLCFLSFAALARQFDQASIEQYSRLAAGLRHATACVRFIGIRDPHGRD